MTRILAAVEYGGEWHLPPVNELFEFKPFLFENSEFFAFNRVALLTLLASAIAAAVFFFAFRKPKLVPGRFQSACEGLVEFIRDQIAIETMGHEGVKWVPLLTTIFLFVWINNLFEVIPFINFPPTSRMALPAFLAIMVYVLFIYAALIILLRDVAWIDGPALAISTAVLLVAVLIWEVRIASRNPKLFWVDASAGQSPPRGVVETDNSMGAGAAPDATPTFVPPVERTRP